MSKQKTQVQQKSPEISSNAQTIKQDKTPQDSPGESAVLKDLLKGKEYQNELPPKTPPQKAADSQVLTPQASQNPSGTTHPMAAQNNPSPLFKEAPPRPNEPRLQVKLFAVAMENTLRSHDAQKGESGWEKAPILNLIKAAEDTGVQIKPALVNETNLDSVMKRAVDLGNYAMMIWDRANMLKKQRGKNS